MKRIIPKNDFIVAFLIDNVVEVEMQAKNDNNKEYCAYNSYGDKRFVNVQIQEQNNAGQVRKCNQVIKKFDPACAILIVDCHML